MAGELGYTVEIETVRGKVGSRQTLDTFAIRVTSVFRNEDGDWKLVHRHADPRVDVQSAESVVEG